MSGAIIIIIIVCGFFFFKRFLGMGMGLEWANSNIFLSERGLDSINSSPKQIFSHSFIHSFIPQTSIEDKYGIQRW